MLADLTQIKQFIESDELFLRNLDDVSNPDKNPDTDPKILAAIKEVGLFVALSAQN